MSDFTVTVTSDDMADAMFHEYVAYWPYDPASALKAVSSKAYIYKAMIYRCALTLMALMDVERHNPSLHAVSRKIRNLTETHAAVLEHDNEFDAQIFMALADLDQFVTDYSNNPLEQAASVGLIWARRWFEDIGVEARDYPIEALLFSHEWINFYMMLRQVITKFYVKDE